MYLDKMPRGVTKKNYHVCKVATVWLKIEATVTPIITLGEG